ncbi:hypothetical protein PFISCL1PPCAC_5435, partial [Pristionchus fissidentatus]
RGVGCKCVASSWSMTSRFAFLMILFASNPAFIRSIITLRTSLHRIIAESISDGVIFAFVEARIQ